MRVEKTRRRRRRRGGGGPQGAAWRARGGLVLVAAAASESAEAAAAEGSFFFFFLGSSATRGRGRVDKPVGVVGGRSARGEERRGRREEYSIGAPSHLLHPSLKKKPRFPHLTLDLDRPSYFKIL